MPSLSWRILLVDDDEDDQILISELLKAIQRRNTTTTAMSSYAAGIQALQQGPYDAILVDYDLGPRDGISWIREAVALGCKAPMIMVTGRGRYEVDLEAMQAGASDYLSKTDLNSSLLERVIRYAVERKQTEQDLRAAKDELELRVDQRTRQLRKANELLEKMFNSLHVGIAYLDKDLKFIRVNHRYADYDGCSEDFFIGKNHFDLYPSAENEAIFRSVIETGQPYTTFARPFVYKYHPERGVTYWDWSLQPVHEPDGTISGMIISLLDVTERKRVEDTLWKTSQQERQAQFQAEKLRTVIDAITDPVMVYDAQGQLTQVNPAATKMYGFDPLGKTGHELLQLVHGQYLDGTPVTLANLPSIRALRGEKLSGEISNFIDLHGQEHLIEVNAAPLYIEGNLLGAVVAWHNISEQKRSELAIQSLAQFPNENPNPVLRISHNGTLEYINPVGAELLGDMGLIEGQKAPQAICQQAQAALCSGERSRIVLENNGSITSLLFVPYAEHGYVNLYGQDLTELRQARNALELHLRQLEHHNGGES